MLSSDEILITNKRIPLSLTDSDTFVSFFDGSNRALESEREA